MFEIFAVDYQSLSRTTSAELFSLRKGTFKDRLNWAVNCSDGMEFDEYDSEHTTYLLGVKDNDVVCSVRLIETRYHNMIVGTFCQYFAKVEIPASSQFFESSRFFVDKCRARTLLANQYPLCHLLFLAMINYTLSSGHQGIYTIVSHPMLRILTRSGWNVSVVEKGTSEKDQAIYLVYLPADAESQRCLIERINQDLEQPYPQALLQAWPLLLAEETISAQSV
ncbi:acyl-homoserine-lactone synthase [Edwardsiella tarda]